MVNVLEGGLRFFKKNGFPSSHQRTPRTSNNNPQDFLLVAGPFWLGTGPLPLDDWAKPTHHKGPTRRFVSTPSALSTLRALGRAVAAGKGAPILLQVRFSREIIYLMICS